MRVRLCPDGVCGECLPQVVVGMPRRDTVVHGGRGVARDGEFLA